MKVSLSWLSDYVNLDGVSVEELQKGLFSCGFEVEEVISLCKSSGIKTCKILEINKHPEADRLSVTKVDAGKYGILQIVTNGTNIKVGDIVPVSIDGAILADGTKIKKGKLRNVDSDGMFCGGEEIGINGDQYPGADEDCILIIKEDLPLGEEFTELIGIKDTIFDISITSNRPDCQSIVGIAKEVACLLNRPFIAPKLFDKRVSGSEVKVTVEAQDLCPLYYASKVTDIKIEESPEWMKKRLNSVGIRSINNIVDITNYVLTEIGQPMHAFDTNFLAGKEINVRRANNGEKIVTLDEKEFTLTENNLVICDKEKAVALAGVMGGLNSGICDNTQEIIFECAKFKRDNIRITSRTLGQRSDSSARYEKGVDVYTTECGILRALYLIEQLNCGKVSGLITEVRAEEPKKMVINTTFEKINKV
ncbi:MAG: phenylalanine--tRNA ligase subunit beta, partial [Clostridia bacterium]|nr:phenylalanine--tRNA ligase subunit beta [Clostridia bacterium]